MLDQEDDMEARIQTGQGELAGVRHDGVSRFLGIPYAAAPFGAGRMRPPEPAPPWVGTRDATQYGPTVPKSPYPWPHNELFDEPVVEGEDCLNLNVWTPDVAGRLPVFVWIHGGAFTNGSGAVPEYDGSAFARDNVVTVTINYRLGADGFLDCGDEHTNVGILDQIAALGFVRDNIAAFGGDPRRVTVGGESAGAMSVAALLASPLSAGLFHGAILESGAGHHALTRATAQKVAAALAERLGVPATRDAIAAVAVDDLLAAQTALSSEVQTNPDPERWGELAANAMAFEPVVDGSVLETLPIEAIRSGSGAEIPVLNGT
ncbi:MAG: carboxylesterase/lipase family protein, partial [Acidimicrobiales bacterium]